MYRNEALKHVQIAQVSYFVHSNSLYPFKSVMQNSGETLAYKRESGRFI